MKAFLLAGGYGTRLKPLTDICPKCLIPVNGVAILQIWLDLCIAHGIDEVLVNLHAHRDIVRDFIARLKMPVKVHLSEEEVLLGSAGTLRAHKGWVAAEPCFWVFYSDVLNCVDLHRMMDFHNARSRVATIGVYRVPDPSRCGIVSVDGSGIVTEFVEKPQQPKSNLAFSGILLATPEMYRYIPERQPIDIGFHVLPQLTGQMAAYEISEYILDIGTLPNYELAQKTWPGARKQDLCSKQ